MKLICPSMMCANFDNLGKEVNDLENANIDIFHIDIMDGNFVLNFGMGLQDFECIRKHSTKLVDVHLMISNPSEYVEFFADNGADIIYIHPETDAHPARTLMKIKDKGKKAGIAINPNIAYCIVEPLLPLVDYVMIMTVNPGFAGQKYLEFVNPKIRDFVEGSKIHDYSVMVDGAISPEKIALLSKEGVTGFILGTSALFGKTKSYKEIVADLRLL